MKECPLDQERVRVIAENFGSGKYPTVEVARKKLKRLWGLPPRELDRYVSAALFPPKEIQAQRELALRAYETLDALRKSVVTTRVRWNLDNACEALQRAFGANCKPGSHSRIGAPKNEST